MIDPEVLYVAATSGMALRTVVDDIGARRPHTESTAVMMILRYSEKRVYWAESDSVHVFEIARLPVAAAPLMSWCDRWDSIRSRSGLSFDGLPFSRSMLDVLV